MNIINIEIAYCSDIVPYNQYIIPITINEGATLLDALNDSDILNICPEIDLKVNRVGIFGKVLSLDTILKNGDRVEIYTNLTMTPMDARKMRAKSNEKNKSKKGNNIKE